MATVASSNWPAEELAGIFIRLAQPVSRMNETPQPALPVATSRLPWRRIARWGVIALVSAAFGWTAWKASVELKSTPFEWRELGWWELIAAGLCYAGALTCAARMWHLVLGSMSVNVSFLTAARAFAASQLAKYVPGKAMVLVVRCGLLCGSLRISDTPANGPNRAPLGPVIASTLVETLMWVLVGAQLGCLGLLFRPGISPQFFWGTLAVIFCFGLLTLPPIFSCGLSVAARVARRPNLDQTRYKLSWLTYGRAWGWSLIGWLWYGSAMHAVLLAVSPAPISWAGYGLALTTICLATVGGFVSILPGGLGVRELVMIPLLAESLTTSGALIAAVLMRVVCVGVELVLSAFCHGVSSAQGSPTAAA